MLLEPLIPVKKRRSDGRGRPPLEPRAVVDGILWICRTGAPWAEMSSKHPPGSSCHRYFQGWVEDGTWDKVLRTLAEDLYERGGIDIREGFIDGSFAAAKKGALVLAKLRKVKAPRSWPSQTLMVFLSPYGPVPQALMK
jgi:transposase